MPGTGASYTRHVGLAIGVIRSCFSTNPQGLTGVEPLVRLLASADLEHNLLELLALLNTFVGSYQLLPAPREIPVSTQAIYRQQSWEFFPVSQLVGSKNSNSSLF
jgi:hypothetical protein